MGGLKVQENVLCAVLYPAFGARQHIGALKLTGAQLML